MKLNVFFLDDEIDLCEQFQEFFSSEQIAITVFTDPLKAIEESKHQKPDLFFIDYRLPNTNGDLVALSLNQTAPMYLLTGEISVNVYYPFKGILVKPYDFKQIQEILDLEIQEKN
ncbi:MAG: response regulator [Bacteriovoracaceae bacterium]|nr:response regulator [Bacteriovoracaceae bacterium]